MNGVLKRPARPVCFILGALFALCTLSSVAQPVADSAGRTTVDTAQASADTSLADTLHTTPGTFQPNPKRAGLYSALVPGLGQLYNRDYWKVPVIYAGIGIAGYFIGHNLNLYLSYREAYIGRINNPNPTDKYVGIYDSSQLKELQNDYSKYLDLTVMITFIGYGVQVVDAVTSAHLKNFDISRNISMKLRPMIMPNFAGMTLTFKYKYRTGRWPCTPARDGAPAAEGRNYLLVDNLQD